MIRHGVKILKRSENADVQLWENVDFHSPNVSTLTHKASHCKLNPGQSLEPGFYHLELNASKGHDLPRCAWMFLTNNHDYRRLSAHCQCSLHPVAVDMPAYASH